MKKIFIIEDEPDLLELLGIIFERDGFEIRKFKSGVIALLELQKTKPDIILMDLMLPDLSGFQLCKKIREIKNNADIPIVVLTSRSDEYDVLNAFEFGCSDYVTKPFNEKILLARVNACLKFKSGSQKDETIVIQGLEINPEEYKVYVDKELIDFTPLEFKLLYFLAQNQSKVFKREQIFDYIYENDAYRSDRSIDILINRIRKKLVDYGDCVETIYGVGYRFRSLDAK